MRISMLMPWIAGALTVAIAAGPRATEREDSRARAAAQRAVALVQRSAAHWTREVGCFSCHHQGVGGLTLALAKELGLTIDEAASAAETEAVYSASEERFEALLAGDGVGVFGRGTTLLALGARETPRDSVTDAVASFLAARQTVTGAWYSNEHRPPFEDSHVTATALTVRSLALYGPEGRAGEMEQRIRRAEEWLRGVRPKDTEERAMRMLGRAWCGVGREALAADCAELIAAQRPDGGWAQLPTTASDAYATGQALVALHQAGGVPPDHPAWARGVRFLLADQREDGTWFVPTRRRIEGQRPRDSGFPYGVHQFSSFLGTCWAVMALALEGREPGPTHAFFGPPPPRAGADPVAAGQDFSPLHRAAAFGSAADVEHLLKEGAAVDACGPRGTTPLMLAVHDPDKVDLLLRYGADPAAESEWGFTPLLSASLVEGAGASVRRFIELGAPVSCRGANGASPALAAAGAGDVATLRVLLDAGARFPGRSLQLALNYAATCDDVAMGRALLACGAELDEGVGRHPPALISAAISGYPAFVRFALEAGAELEARDGAGMTALSWAAKVDPGHTRVLRLLLQAGADVNARDEGGMTPLDWASRFGNRAHLALLRAAGARPGTRADAALDEQR